MNEQQRGPVVEVVEPEQQFVMVLPNQRAGFLEQWSGAYSSAEEWLRVAWVRGRDAWLHQTESAHTRRSYEHGSVAWMEFLAGLRGEEGTPVKLWQVTGEHVRLWMEQMVAKGAAPGTINQRLAACSSWYSFMINERALVDGYEISAFMDRGGQTRLNPFRGNNVKRAKAERYSGARKLKKGETDKLLRYLGSEQKLNTLLGARNYALILTFLLTGYRNVEVAGMRWGNIMPSTVEPGKWLYAWSGKGGRSQTDPLPDRVYGAIVYYLKKLGRRPEEMGKEEYIFTPLVTHNLQNLQNQALRQAQEVEGGHLSTTQVEQILRTALRKAGIKEPDKVRVHDLRHTFAVRFYEAKGDIKALQERLHHKSLATTDIYVREFLEEPTDNYSEQLYQGLLGI